MPRNDDSEWSEDRPDDLTGCDIDYADLFCPRCGANDVLVIDLPRPGGWFKASGNARCNLCDAKFALRLDMETDC